MDAIKITTTGTVTRVVIPEGEGLLSSLQEHVGGYVETVSLTPTIALLCDDEGKLKARPANAVANRLVNFLGTRLQIGDYICGDVVILGDTDEGDFVSIDEGIIAAIANL